MERIRARFGDGVHRARRVLAILRRQTTGLELEFLAAHPGNGSGQVEAVDRIVVRRSVEKVSEPVMHAAGDRDVTDG